jgi:ABC-type sugar transport systems, permease components
LKDKVLIVKQGGWQQASHLLNGGAGMYRGKRWGILFVLPYVVSILVLFIFPVIFSFYIAFTKWDFFNAPTWVGLKNWVTVISDENFRFALRNVLLYALIFVPIQTLIALVLAFILNKTALFGKLYKALFFIPVVTPWMAGGLAWGWLYNYDYGILNWILGSIGIDKIHWLDNKNWWLVIFSIAMATVWKGCGYSMVLFLAGIQNISQEMTEAADIDGASKWIMFRKIIVPIISPTTFLVMILSTISAFNAFDVFLIMLNNGEMIGVPMEYNVVNLLVYKEAFYYTKMGTASTMAWILFLIILTVTIVQKKLEARWVHYEK